MIQYTPLIKDSHMHRNVNPFPGHSQFARFVLFLKFAFFPYCTKMTSQSKTVL